MSLDKLDKNDKHDKDAPKREPKAEKPAEPPVQEYPKMLYHEDGRMQTVANAEEEAALKQQGFTNTAEPPKAEPKAKG